MTEKGGKTSWLWLTRRGGEYPSHSCPACAELRRGKPGQIPPERGYGDINGERVNLKSGGLRCQMEDLLRILRYL